MNSSNMIPMLALAGAGSVMVVFWGASMFTGSSETTEPAVANVIAQPKKEAVKPIVSSSANDSFSWDDDEPTETTTKPAVTETETAEAFDTANDTTDEFGSDEFGTDEFGTDEFGSDEPTAENSSETFAEAETKEPLTEVNETEDLFGEAGTEDLFAKAEAADAETKEPLAEAWGSSDSSDESGSDSKEAAMAKSLEETSEPVNETFESTPSETKTEETLSEWAPAEPTDSLDIDPMETQPVEPSQNELADTAIETIEPIKNEEETNSPAETTIEIPAIVPTYTLTITNQSGDTAQFCVDGEAVTLPPGDSYFAEKSDNGTFEYRETCEQVSSVPMKAGRYNVKAFPKSTQTSNQAYRAKSATQN